MTIPKTTLTPPLRLFSIPPDTDILVQKTDSVDPVAAGGFLTYTITVTNNTDEDLVGLYPVRLFAG